MTTFGQAWREVYGTPEAWERERDGEPEPVYEYGDVFAQELADTREAERLKRERRPVTVAPLPLPDDVRLTALIEVWPLGFDGEPWPRSAWLHDFEMVLRQHYPTASSDRLTLTARLAAPFPLALPGVP